MVPVPIDAGDGRAWVAVRSESHGRTFTLEEAETAALAQGLTPGFLVELTSETRAFGAGDHPPSLGIVDGDSIWSWGQPTRAAVLSVMRQVADGAESPDPQTVLLPVRAVVDEAIRRFGRCDSHEVETQFDRHVLRMGGRRTEAPPAYVVLFSSVFGT